MLVGSCLLIGGCGQTGPLYLADNPEKTVDGR
ncbi:lipoprotein [Litorivicinus sp.]|nr:lipoprotein [Litorivicinus sp.]MDB9862873.1 lipoprotein [Litorivicinus sp.]MDC1208325.1 lipoprotein [Litorivicinus sp.]MDC1239422.1 lipoprotein [Litorivicinus sp.]MDC1319844.1 lipoprotein [Litorivicinus sp.]